MAKPWEKYGKPWEEYEKVPEKPKKVEPAKSIWDPAEVAKGAWQTVKNYPKDVAETFKALERGIVEMPGQTIANLVYNPKAILKDISTVGEALADYPAKKIADIIVEKEKFPVEELKRQGKFIQEHPFQAQLNVTAGLTGAGKIAEVMGFPKAAKALTTASQAASPIAPAKIIGEVGKRTIAGLTAKAPVTPGAKTVPTASLVRGKLQTSTIKNLADPKVRAEITPLVGERADDLVFKAGKSLDKAHSRIKGVQSKFYTDLGITDDTLIRVDDALDDIYRSIDDFKGKSIGPHARKAARTAESMADDILGKMDKQGNIKFGQIKSMKNSFYDEASRAMADIETGTSESRFMTKLGKRLNDAKLSHPDIAKASTKFRDLEKVDDMFDRIFRLDKPTGDMTAERAVASRYRDIGNATFREYMDDAVKTLEKYPEATDIADFASDVRIAQTATDIAKTTKAMQFQLGEAGLVKTALQTAISGISPVGTPAKRATTISKLITAGKISPERLLGETVEVTAPIGGVTRTRLRGIRELFGG